MYVICFLHDILSFFQLFLRTFKIFGRQLLVVLKDQKINYTFLMQIARQNLCGNHEEISVQRICGLYEFTPRGCFL